MDDQARRETPDDCLQCWYSPSGVERRGSKAMLRAAGHVDPGYVPEATHRVQSPTSGAWHPCECSRAKDHVGTMAPSDPISAGLAILAARGYEATDPVILTMPREMADMVDWASDPSVVRLPLAAEDPLRF